MYLTNVSLLITQGLLVAGAIESRPAAEGEEQRRRAF